MSPLSNTNNNNNSSSLTLSSNNNNNNNNSNNTSNSAFKPLINENRQLNMLSSSGVAADHYSNDLTSPYGGAAYHHHHHLNSQLSTQDYLNVHHQTLPLGVYKSEHDELQGYSFARPVKLYEHSTSIAGMGNGTVNSVSTVSSPSSGLVGGSGATNVAYANNPHQNGFRSDAPSPGASIIDLSTSSVTSLRSGVGGAGFTNAPYYDGQRYDRSPQSASSPHYSSPQMLSPQGQTLDLSVGRPK